MLRPARPKSSATPQRNESGLAGSGLNAIDAQFESAGLVRNRRDTAAGITRELRQLRLERMEARVEAEELRQLAPAPRIAANGVPLLAVQGWEKRGWLWHGFSTRLGGVSRAYLGAEAAEGELNLGFTAADEQETVMRNRRLFAEAVSGDAATPLVTLRQIHSNGVHSVARWDAGRERPLRGDGLMTDEPGLLLGVQTADCIPVLVADRKKKAVAAFHAGWRGTVKRIVETGIGRMRAEFGSKPEDLIAAIGPSVGACCYAVGDEVQAEFESQFAYARELFREVYDSDPVRKKYPMLFLTQRAPGHSPIGPALHLDLVEANRRQLLDAGLKAGAIQTAGGCTSCQPELFFSHRASQGHAGRMMSVIGIRAR
jgi:polyphenol oxidase